MPNIDIEAPGSDLAALLAAIADLSPVQSIAQTYVAGSAVTGTTNETVVATIPIPIGTVKAGDKIVVIPHFSMAANNANVKTGRVRLGGIGGTEIWNGAMASTLQVKPSIEIEFITLATQRAFNLNNLTGFGTTTAAVVTAAVDFSAAVDIVVTVDLDNGADSVTLLGYSATLYRAP
jgi:hypothetical protein